MSSKADRKHRYVMWGGFERGKSKGARFEGGTLVIWRHDFGGVGASTQRSPAIFTSKREARKHFEDVRRIEIVESANG